MSYKSIDTVVDKEDCVHYPTEILNSLTSSGMPQHIITVKVGAPVMLLRNLNPPKLCNGTRLRVTKLKRNVIEAEVISGAGEGETVLIPRIPLLSPSDHPFQFKRLQFPLKVCFAITINKSQGQFIKFTGVDLREGCFSHGQLYVACSRASTSANLYILCPDKKTPNVVYRKVL
jgi:ATP-dependent DNA helicase PIF1